MKPSSGTNFAQNHEKFGLKAQVFLGLGMRNSLLLPVATALLLFGCTPTVKVQAPDEPIEINLNVKIEHEIRVKVDKDIDELLSENKDLF